MTKPKQPAPDALVGSAYIAAALDQSSEHISRALGSLFSQGEYYIQLVGKSYVLPRKDADALIALWRDKRSGAPRGNQNASKRGARDVR